MVPVRGSCRRAVVLSAWARTAHRLPVSTGTRCAESRHCAGRSVLARTFGAEAAWERRRWAMRLAALHDVVRDAAAPLRLGYGLASGEVSPTSSARRDVGASRRGSGAR